MVQKSVLSWYKMVNTVLSWLKNCAQLVKNCAQLVKIGKNGKKKRAQLVKKGKNVLSWLKKLCSVG